MHHDARLNSRRRRFVGHPAPQAVISAAAMLFFLAAAILMTAVAGCGGGETTTAEKPAPPAADASGPAVIVFDTGSFDAWLDLSERIGSGAEVPAAEIDAILDLPGYLAYRDPDRSKVLHPRQFEYALRDAFSPDGPDWTTGAPRSRLAVPPLLKQNFAYLKTRRPEAARMVRDLCAPGVLAGIFDRLEGFVPPDAWPDTLTVHFVAANPGTAVRDGERILIDAGLALAVGVEDLIRLLAGNLYSVLTPADFPRPETSAGTAALAATYRRLAREGVMAWVQDYPLVTFDSLHEAFAEFDDHRTAYRDYAHRALVQTDKMIGALAATPGLMDERGTVIDDLMRFNDLYSVLGYAIAERIAGHGGRDALVAASADAADFLRAYQQAALAEPQDPKTPPYSEANLGIILQALADHPAAPRTPAPDPRSE